MNKTIFLSVIVPLYNEEGNVEELHNRIVSACEKLEKPYEIIFVDDGSSDKTLSKARLLSPLILIEFRKNFGQTAAFDAGIKASHGEIIVMMDGDLQNDPSDIPLLLDKMNEGFDVVAGWRFKRQDRLMKKIFSRGANILRKMLLHDTIHDSGCSLKAYRRECFDGLDLFGEMHRFIPALLEMDGYKVSEVKVSHHARMSGNTKYNWRRSVKGLVDMIWIWFWRKYSSRPVHFFGGGGLMMSFFGFGILVWMLFEKLYFHNSLAEKIWPLIGLFLILIGLQLFIFGILLDVVTKNYYKERKRMNYVIRNVRIL